MRNPLADLALTFWLFLECVEAKKYCWYFEGGYPIYFIFPGQVEDQDVRQKWMKYINRDGFEPNKITVVCGIHFPDGQPTKENLYPVLLMGYDCSSTLARPPPKRRCPQPLYLNSTSEPEAMETDVDVGNLENMPLQTNDVGIQWPDHVDFLLTTT
ncbi:uncharacterized protein vopp1 isoform X2 [Acanthopagrus latus]|uniref:uncharacterized protein vopp1 isoform X2 n=1 Tax=Acanthopagrus latus TaxID=8177 RepID=UPI00187CC1A5|nr:uncharacterized protein vopp1 isoform X2 [Acanthopagrus latus]